MSGDQEPWVFRGGLTAELQRLLPLDNVSDLYVWKAPDVPSTKMYHIRPYENNDKDSVYGVCLKTCDDGLDGTEVFPGQPDLIGDKLIGGFITLSPELCFVVEDECGRVVGAALAALDAKQYSNRYEVAWIPELCDKYPAPKQGLDMLTPAEEIIVGFHSYKSHIPQCVYQHHPSIARIHLLPSVSDFSVVKRLVSCTLSALKANGSCGVLTEISIGDKATVEFYSKIGFLEIPVPGEPPADSLYMGRIF